MNASLHFLWLVFLFHLQTAYGKSSVDAIGLTHWPINSITIFGYKFHQNYIGAVPTVTIDSRTTRVQIETDKSLDLKRCFVEMVVNPFGFYPKNIGEKPITLLVCEEHDCLKPMDVDFIKDRIPGVVDLKKFHEKRIRLRVKCNNNQNPSPMMEENMYFDFNANIPNPLPFELPSIVINYEKVIEILEPLSFVSKFIATENPESDFRGQILFSSQAILYPGTRKTVAAPHYIEFTSSGVQVFPRLPVSYPKKTVSSGLTSTNVFNYFKIWSSPQIFFLREPSQYTTEWMLDNPLIHMELVANDFLYKDYQCRVTLEETEESPTPKHQKKLFLNLMKCNKLNCGLSSVLQLSPKLIGGIKNLDQLHGRIMLLAIDCRATDDDVCYTSEKFTYQIEIKAPRTQRLTDMDMEVFDSYKQSSVPITSFRPTYLALNMTKPLAVEDPLYSNGVLNINADGTVKVGHLYLPRQDILHSLEPVTAPPLAECGTIEEVVPTQTVDEVIEEVSESLPAEQPILKSFTLLDQTMTVENKEHIYEIQLDGTHHSAHLRFDEIVKSRFVCEGFVYYSNEHYTLDVYPRTLRLFMCEEVNCKEKMMLHYFLGDIQDLVNINQFHDTYLLLKISCSMEKDQAYVETDNHLFKIHPKVTSSALLEDQTKIDELKITKTTSLDNIVLDFRVFEVFERDVGPDCFFYSRQIFSKDLCQKTATLKGRCISAELFDKRYGMVKEFAIENNQVMDIPSDIHFEAEKQYNQTILEKGEAYCKGTDTDTKPETEVECTTSTCTTTTTTATITVSCEDGNNNDSCCEVEKTPSTPPSQTPEEEEEKQSFASRTLVSYFALVFWLSNCFIEM